MNIHFKLNKTKAKDSVIYLWVFDSRFTDRKFIYSTRFRVENDLWQEKKERAKVIPARGAELISLNKHLDLLQQKTIEYLSERRNSMTLSRDDLKKHLEKGKVDERKAEVDKFQNENTFFEKWQEIINTTKIDGKPIALATRRSKMQTLNLVKDFCYDNRIKLTFETIDMDFYHAFDAFMAERYTSRGKPMSVNTRGKHFQEIKALLREAKDRDYPVNLAYQKKSFKVMSEKVDDIFLNEEEIKHLYKLELPKTLAKHRDTFVMACFVGARHSDWHKINQRNIVNENGRDMLKIHQQKTDETIVVPIHSVVRLILNKYNGFPPKVPCTQHFNSILKKIGKMKKCKALLKEKSEQITTHTARRSFATNAYLSRSMNVLQIMRCTGHKSESSFLKYLKLNNMDFAIELSDNKFFNDSSWNFMEVAS